MDLQALSLPDWLPVWVVIGLFIPVAFYVALFLLMPFSTFGLRARLRELELHIEALHEEIRALTLRLPERGPMRDMDGFDDEAPLRPPIPPAPRENRPVREAAPRAGGFGDPVADRMLAYMREKARDDMDRAEGPREAPRPARPRAEPRFIPPAAREPELPPPPPLGGLPGDYPAEPVPPPPPRVPGRFGRRVAHEDDAGDAVPDPDAPPPGGARPSDPRPGDPRIDWPR